MQVRDALGSKLELERPPVRIVSLVPSLTETLFALNLAGNVVGVTRFCVEPAKLVEPLPRVGGTKNPNLGAIAELAPDIVIANAEENRKIDVERLRALGIPVFVTYPRSVASAVETILNLGQILARAREAAMLARRIVRVVSGIETALGIRNKIQLRVFCPIWKKPWMTFNQDTYAHDVLRLMGFCNVFGDRSERYPKVTLEEALALDPEVILLPDEPYRFTDSDALQLKTALPPDLSRRLLLISGRDLHWYGAHMAVGLLALAERLGRVRASMQPVH